MESGVPFRYLEHLCEVYRKFFRCLWKQQTSFSWNRETLSEFSNPIFNGISSSCFWWMFTASWNFVYGLYEHVQGICKIHLMQFLALVKQSGLNDIPIKFYIKKSENNWDYEKMPLKMGLEHSNKVSRFQLRLVCCQ